MQKNVVIEQISIKIGMIILKSAILIRPGGHFESSFLYVFCYFSQILAFQKITVTPRPKEEKMQDENNSKKKEKEDKSTEIKLPLICMFLFFTMEQFFYRTTHRERFSSF